MNCSILVVANKKHEFNQSHPWSFAEIGCDSSPDEEKNTTWWLVTSKPPWHGNNTVSCYVCAAMIRLLQFGAAPLPFSQLAAGWKFIDLSAVKKSNYIIQLLLMYPNVAFCNFVFDMCCFFLYIISLSQCRWHKAALFLWCQGTNRSYRVISRYWVIKSEDFSLECISALWVVPENTLEISWIINCVWNRSIFSEDFCW